MWILEKYGVKEETGFDWLKPWPLYFRKRASGTHRIEGLVSPKMAM
jgi:hypothetical protein